MGQIIELRPRLEASYAPTANIGVVIQARMTSKRFPGKSMAMLDGKPLIQHVIERCKLIRGPIKVLKPITVVVAVPDAPESEPLLHHVTDKMGVTNFCGSEDNVLERYMACANFFKFDVIMRITADCPLIDPQICSEVLQLLMWRKVDYASNCHQDRTFPKGLDCEVFTYDCLEYTYVTVKERYKEVSQLLEGPKLGDFKQSQKECLYDMEHVTPFMIRTPGIKKALVKCLTGDFSNKDWCVDFPSDIQKIEKIIGQAKKIMQKKAIIIPAIVSESNVLH